MPILEHKSWEGGISPFADRGIRGSSKFISNCDIRKSVDTLSCGQALIEEGELGGTHSSSPSKSQSSSQSPSRSASSSPSASNSPSKSQSPSASASSSASKSQSPSGSASPSSSGSASPSASTGASVFEDLIIKFVKASDGNTYGFGNLGHVYRRYSDGFWTMVYTDPDGGIRGAIEKPSSGGTTSLQWATATKMKKKPLPGLSNWTDVETIAENLTDAQWHTMEQVGGANYICNGSHLAMVGYDDSWTNEALDLIPGNIAKTIIERSGRAVIGTVREWNLNRGVNAMLDTEFPLAQIGSDGELFFSDFNSSMPIRRFPGGGKVNPGGASNVIDQVNIFDWEQTALSWVDKQTLGNMSMWGVFNADTNMNGVYYFGRNHKDQPFTLNLEFALEVDEIGAVVNVDGITLISYKDGSDYGVKASDPDNKATGTWEGLEWRSPVKQSETETEYKEVEVLMNALPSGCKVDFYYKKDKTGSWVHCKTADGNDSFTLTGGKKAVFLIGADMDIYEPRIILTPSGNNTPEIFRVRTYFD